MTYRNIPWKRNLMKIPRSIFTKVKQIAKPVVVGATLNISKPRLEAGTFKHLGIHLVDGKLVMPKSVVPLAEMGRWSNTNLFGREIARDDLPMIKKTFSIEAPNWGGYGTHTVSHERDVYQRDYIAPKHLAINFQLLGHDPIKDIHIIQCTTDEVLDPADSSFEDELFYNLNLVQENTGHVSVFAAGASREEYLKTLSVAWEILPPGEREKNITIILGTKNSSPEVRAAMVERYELLEKMKPKNFVSGTSGFDRYFGAQFADDLVVFENVEYGNAAYVMGENWETQSRLSRTELLTKANRDFIRVPHVKLWKEKLSQTVREELKKRNK